MATKYWLPKSWLSNRLLLTRIFLMWGRFYLLALFIFFVGCRHDEQQQPANEVKLFTLPSGFPSVPFPAENAFSQKRWLLGKKLFYDKAMSRTQTVSCASCHKPELAFSDNVPVSAGVENRKGLRNASPLANIAYHPYYTREGGVPTLEMQVLVPIQEHVEFDFNIVDIQDRLKTNPAYAQLSVDAYARPFDYYVITRALATFERSLISGNSRYDQAMNQRALLTATEQNGKQLFFGERTNCSQCHSGFNFTSYAFENNGLYEVYADEGRKRLTNKEEDLARFKIPSLRNVGVTSPYMHDGSLQTLKSVVAHYNSGGKNHPNKSTLIKPLNLTDKEQEELVAFLKTLTDIEFISNPLLRQ